MRNWLLSLFALCCLWCSISPAVVRAVTVSKIDDTSVVGDFVSLTDDGLAIALPLRQPSTRPALNATTQASTQSDDRTITIKMADISRVVVREPQLKLPSVQVPGPAKTRRHTPTQSQAAGGAPAQGQIKPSSQPSPGSQWQLKPRDGDILNGTIDHWADGKISFSLSGIDGATMEFPADQLLELWDTDLAARAKARALPREPGPEDIAFVRKDADVIAVKGLVISIDENDLHFRFDEQDRKIALAKLVGFIQGSGEHQKSSEKFHQRIKLESGDEISGTWTAASADAINLQTSWGSVLQLPLSKIYSIDFLNGRVVYLSDLKPDTVDQVPYFGHVMSWRADHALEGGPLRLSDGQYAKGIAMHSRCVLDYEIGGHFERFNTKVGFEQPAGKNGTAVLRVLGDGKVLYENLDARGDQPPVTVDLDVKSVQHLKIEVDFGKVPEIGARVIWANARLLKANLPE